MTGGLPSGRVHFVGVGGAGMSAVAWLLAAAGVEVSGTDAADGPYLRALAGRGLDVTVGHDAARVKGAQAIVVTSAVREDNPELVAARAAGIDVWHRSVALARAAAGKRMLAVAGAHGKTTTSAMAAHMLHACGIDASFAIGAPVHGVDGAVGGAYAGTADVIVIEADESDGSFLNYDPDVAIITNIEADHLDHYGTADAVEAAFREFAARAATLVACADDAPAAAVAEAARAAGRDVLTYGSRGEPDVKVGSRRVSVGDAEFELEVPFPGWHYRLNAAAAWAGVVALDAPPDRASAASASFAGTGRRFELRGEVGDIKVYDDYAHHPTEIAAVLEAVRASHNRQIVVLFQPHLYSRTRLLADEFAAALSDPVSAVVVAGVYGAREDPEPGIDATTITRLMKPNSMSSVDAVEDLREAATRAVDRAEDGAIIITMGAGSVTDAADWILDDLRARGGDG